MREQGNDIETKLLNHDSLSRDMQYTVLIIMTDLSWFNKENAFITNISNVTVTSS